MMRIRRLRTRTAAPAVALVALLGAGCGRPSAPGTFPAIAYVESQPMIVLPLLERESDIERGVPVAFGGDPRLEELVFAAARERNWPLKAWDLLGEEAERGIRVEQVYVDNQVSGRIHYSVHGGMEDLSEIHFEGYWITDSGGFRVIGPARLLRKVK